MTSIENLVRKNILELQPYSCARDEFQGPDDAVFLDANENPYGKLNRYPDPYQRELKNKLSDMKAVSAENIFIGNGSDEVIDLAFRIFCNPGKDKALTFSPTYGMYEVSAAINDVELLKIPLNEEFQIDLKKVDERLKDESIKLIFICSPNNPTGNLIDQKAIEYILKTFSGIVILDEAYIDFAQQKSLTSLLSKYPNLIVIQTLSKAWGLASMRIGMAFSNPEIIGLYNKVKPPYNVSLGNQQAALKALDKVEQFEQIIAAILEERDRLIAALQKIPLVKRIYPTDANFILIEVSNADQVYSQLVSENIITRNRSKLVQNCIRISVGKPRENARLISTLKNLK